MDAADILILLIGALGYFTAFILLRRMRRRDKLSGRVTRSLGSALRQRRVE